MGSRCPAPIHGEAMTRSLADPEFEALRCGMISLRDVVRENLPPEDQRQIADLIDANEFGVALEWILDTVSETDNMLPPSALELVEKLAKEMDMYSAVLDRLPQRHG